MSVSHRCSPGGLRQHFVYPIWDNRAGDFSLPRTLGVNDQIVYTDRQERFCSIDRRSQEAWVDGRSTFPRGLVVLRPLLRVRAGNDGSMSWIS